MKKHVIATRVIASALSIILSVPTYAFAAVEIPSAESVESEALVSVVDEVTEEGTQEPAAIVTDTTGLDEDVPSEAAPDSDDEVVEVEGVIDETTSEDEGQQEQVAAEDVSEEEEPATLEEQAVEAETSEAQKALDSFAKSHKNDLAPGRYKIATKFTDKLSLSISGSSKNNGGKTVLATSSSKSSKRWDIELTADGYYMIKNVNSGKYLDVSGGEEAVAKGAAVVQWETRDEAARSQRWIIQKTAAGVYKIVSGVATSDGKHLVLSVEGGAQKKGAAAVLGVEKSGTNSDQLWHILTTDDILDTLASQHASDVANGVYAIGSGLNYKSNKTLFLSIKKHSKSNKASAVVYGRATTGAKASDAWRVKHTSAGYVTLTNVYTGKLLDVKDASIVEGSKICQKTDAKGTSRSQLWILVKQDDGSFRIYSAVSGDYYLTLQISKSKAVSGRKVILANKASRKSQAWNVSGTAQRYNLITKLNNKTVFLATTLDPSMAVSPYKSNTAAGTKNVLYSANNASIMKWKIVFDVNGYAHLTNAAANKQLGFSSEGLAVLASGSYRWLVESPASNKYTFCSKTGDCSGKYLNVRKSKTTSGTKVTAAAATGKDQQVWQFNSVTGGLDGVDISGWNTGITYSKLGDFVIVKATEWNSDTKTYTSYNDYENKADKALAAGKLIGFYHFATNPTTSGQSMAKQAKGFINAISVKDANGNYKYRGKAVLFLDWEDTSYSKVESTQGVTWAKQWLDYVYEKTGIMPMIYMNKNCTNAYNWSSVANAGYELWGAQYLNKYYSENSSTMITSFVADPTLTSGWGAWGTPVLYQYTSTCRLHGSKVYDVNKFYGTKAAWLKRAAAK